MALVIFRELQQSGALARDSADALSAARPTPGLYYKSLRPGHMRMPCRSTAENSGCVCPDGER